MTWLSKPPLGTLLDWAHPLNRGLICFLPMHEGAGDVLRDIVNDNVCQFTNVTQGSTEGWTGGRNGGGAFRSDGTSSAYDAAFSHTLNGASQASMSAWIWTDSTGSFANCPVYYPNAVATQALGIVVINATTLRFDVAGVGTNITVPSITNSWHHVAVSWDGTTRRSYLDGQQIEAAAKTGPIVTSTNQLNICRFSSSNVNIFKGVVDDVRLWNRAITADEMRQLYSEPWGVFRSTRIADRFVPAAGGTTVARHMLQHGLYASYGRAA